jgi:mono/diheme cytochrome c family protein
MTRTFVGVRAVLPAALLGALLVVGCQKPAAPTPSVAYGPGPGAGVPNLPQGQAPVPADVPAQFVAARKTFDASCARCHAIGDKGGPGPGGPPMAGGPGPGGPGPGGPGGPRGRGPNLARVGAEHNSDWIAEHIRDPQAHKQNSRMPRFGDKLSAADIKAVADYLASLKGT